MFELRSIIDLTGNGEQYIKSREKMAEDILRRMRGKLFFYNIPDLDTDMSFCTIENITYDKLMDTFIYVIKDCDTSSIFITERCNIFLVEALQERAYYRMSSKSVL